jgi:hypothetical protein
VPESGICPGLLRRLGRGPIWIVLWLAGWGGLQSLGAEGSGSFATNTLPLPVAPVAARSVSGQFIVYGEKTVPTGPGRIPSYNAATILVPVKADWLVVGAERVKRAVLNEFGAGDRWQGRIHLYLKPRWQLGERPIRIVPVPFRDGWQYRVEIPDEVEWPRLVRALVEAVLLEAANREAGTQVAQLPLWLSEGIAESVLALHGPDLLPQGQTALLHTERRPHVVTLAAQRLQGQSPLLFSELSFPSDAMITDPAAWSRFQGSALLLTHELLGDDAGKAAMRETMRLLPQGLNWQTAFLQAHSRRFLSLLEVEKWWAVNSSYLLVRDPASILAPSVAAAQLTALLREPVELAGGTNGTAIRREVSLSEVITEWDFPAQRPVLERKLGQLRRMYQVAPVKLVPLVSEYHQALGNYLRARQGGMTDALRRSELEPRARLAVQQTVRKLKELDRQLAAWGPGGKPPTP